jgi:hypothetical protein
MAHNVMHHGKMRAYDGARMTLWFGRRILADCLRLPALLLIAFALACPSASGAQTQAVKGEVFVTTSGGFARLLFKLSEDVESNVRVNGAVVVITFKRPVAISVDRINAQAPDYVSAARRDPNGLGVRLALARKVTVNTMAAGERLFVDFLPTNWSGLPPGLPQEVIEELARRTREAEKKARRRQVLERQRNLAPVRVRVATEPTFTRYVFPLPGSVGVSTDRGGNKLTLLFDSPIKFDLADANTALPPTIETINSELDEDAASVRFALIGKVDVRTFREDNESFVVDITTADSKNTPVKDSLKSDDLAALAAEAARKKK